MEQVVKVSGLTSLYSSQPKQALLRCEKHGEYLGWETIIEGELYPSQCPECDKEESLRISLELADFRAAAREKEKNRTALTAAGIPPRFQRMSFKEFQPTCDKAAKVRDRIGNFILNFKDSKENGTSFLFSGNTGAGKTHLACAAANNLIRMGYSAIYVSSLNYITRVKAAWNPAAGLSESDILEEHAKPDLLILDEIGKGEMNAKERGMIFQIIDRRYEECKPTIGISIFSPEKLSQLINEDAVRRLKAGGGGILLFDWPAYE